MRLRKYAASGSVVPDLRREYDALMAAREGKDMKVVYINGRA